MISKFKGKLVSILAGASALAFTSIAHAQATVPTEISDMVDNAETVWSSVKTVIVGVVGFIILIGFVKMVKKK